MPAARLPRGSGRVLENVENPYLSTLLVGRRVLSPAPRIR